MGVRAGPLMPEGSGVLELVPANRVLEEEGVEVERGVADLSDFLGVEKWCKAPTATIIGANLCTAETTGSVSSCVIRRRLQNSLQ